MLPVPARALTRFVREEGIASTVAARLFADPASALFAAAGFNLRFDSRASFTSVHAKTSVLSATWRGLVLGLTTGMAGDPRQQGGAFILERQHGSGGGEWRQAWAHMDRHNADQAPLPVLLAAAGLDEAAIRRMYSGPLYRGDEAAAAVAVAAEHTA